MIRAIKTAALAAALALPALAPALAFDGVYGEVCDGEGEFTPLTIRDRTAYFYETVCGLTNPIDVRDMDGAVLFDLTCEGEGMAWTMRALLQPAWDGGLILLMRNVAQTLPRCS